MIIILLGIISILLVSAIYLQYIKVNTVVDIDILEWPFLNIIDENNNLAEFHEIFNILQFIKVFRNLQKFMKIDEILTRLCQDFVNFCSNCLLACVRACLLALPPSPPS